jgi:hypothetical protein
MATNDDGDDWGEEVEAPKAAAPTIIMVGRVIRDYFPETSTRGHLTLLLGMCVCLCVPVPVCVCVCVCVCVYDDDSRSSC